MKTLRGAEYCCKALYLVLQHIPTLSFSASHLLHLVTEVITNLPNEIFSQMYLWDQKLQMFTFVVNYLCGTLLCYEM